MTYGAGGSTRERTHDTVARIARETTLTPAAHLTCVGASRAEVEAVAHRYKEAGIRHIVALRGDALEGESPYRPHPHGYAYAADLVAGLKRVGDFEISVAAYPETHPEATSAQADLDNLKRKIDAGASRAITQFFFDVGRVLPFPRPRRQGGHRGADRARHSAVTNFGRVKKFAAACGASVPGWMGHMFEGLDTEPETRRLVAATVAGWQCRALVAGGAPDLHFYTLNQADLVFAMCHLLGVRAKEAAPAS